MNRLNHFLAACLLAALAASCQTMPKVPPPQAVKVEGVQIISGDFQGRFEAFADVTGYLSNGAAQLVEPRQWRQGYRLYIEVNEQLPADTAGATVMVPFQRRIPIEIAGLAPGVYLVNINGREEHLEIDGSGLRPAEDRGQFL